MVGNMDPSNAEAVSQDDKMELCQKVMYRVLFSQRGAEIIEAIRLLVLEGCMKDFSIADDALFSLRFPEDTRAALTLAHLLHKAMVRPGKVDDSEVWALVLRAGAESHLSFGKLFVVQETWKPGNSPQDKLEIALRAFAKEAPQSVVALYRVAKEAKFVGAYQGKIAEASIPLTELLSILDNLQHGGGLLKLAGLFEQPEVPAAKPGVSEAEWEKLKGAHLEATNALKRAEGELHEKEAKLKRAEGELHEKEAVLSRLRAVEPELAKAKTDAARLQSEGAKLQQEISKVKQDLLRAGKDRDETRRSLGEAQTKLKLSLDAATKKAAAEKKERERLSRTEEQRVKAEEAHVSEKKRTEAEMMALRIQLQESVESRERLQAEVAKLTTDLATSDANHTALSTELSSLKQSRGRPVPPRPPQVESQQPRHKSMQADQAPSQPKSSTNHDDDFKAFFKYIAKHPVPS